MIDENIIRALKQSNISENAAKTKSRVQELWKSASRAEKNIVEETAGISRATIYRVYNTGSISAKLAATIAQNFNIDPNYIIGKTDEPGICNDKILMQFLSYLGYNDLEIPEKSKKRAARGRKRVSAQPETKTATPVAEEVVIAPQTEEVFVSKPAPVNDASDLNLADLQLLMQSLLLREKHGVAEAAEKAAKLRALLLS